MAGFTGDVLELVNEYLKERYDDLAIDRMKTYNQPLFDRISSVSSEKQVTAHIGGKGVRTAIQTKQSQNARPRRETEDFPFPAKSEYKQLTVKTTQFAASVGLSVEAMREAAKDVAGLGSLVMDKIEDLKYDMRTRLAWGANGDGTGRLGIVATWTAGTGTFVLDNTAHEFGWKTTWFIKDGMVVDILTPSDSGNWTVKATNLPVVSVNHAAGSFVVDATDENANIAATPGDGDYVFLAGSVNAVTGSTVAWTDYTEMMGLWGIVDDGSSTYASGGMGTFRGNDYFGIADRTIIPSLKSVVVNFYDGGLPVDWDLELLNDYIRAVEDGDTGGKVTALYMNSKMLSCLARMAALQQNATATVNNGKVTGGYYSLQLRCDERLIPLISTGIRLPPNCIIGVDERKLHLFKDGPIQFVNGATNKFTKDEIWFPSPASRNMTNEAWLHAQMQLFARRCDSSFKLCGLKDTL